MSQTFYQSHPEEEVTYPALVNQVLTLPAAIDSRMAQHMCLAALDVAFGSK